LALEVYSALTDLATTLSDNWAAAVTAKSATVSTPSGYTVIEPGLTRLPQSGFPQVLIVPAGRGQRIPITHESSSPLVRWELPVRIWIGLSDSSGSVSTAQASAADHLQIVDYILTTNRPSSSTEGGAGRFGGFGKFETEQGTIWGAHYDLTLTVRPIY